MSESWQRVAIVGCSGAGKSTLARRLAELTGSPHILLDDLGLGPDWQTRPVDDLRADVDRATTGDRWIADGNWRPVRDLVWGRATAIVWLDLPLAVCFRRVFFRTLRRSLTGERVCNGNRETLWKAFATRGSILRWVLATHGQLRQTLPAELMGAERQGKVTRRLSNAKEVDRFVAGFGELAAGDQQSVS